LRLEEVFERGFQRVSRGGGRGGGGSSKRAEGEWVSGRERRHVNRGGQRRETEENGHLGFNRGGPTLDRM
jgi:hypothetical protein